jgi:hypothetical protein
MKAMKMKMLSAGQHESRVEKPSRHDVRVNPRDNDQTLDNVTSAEPFNR